MDGIRRKGRGDAALRRPGIDPGSIEATLDRGMLTASARREDEHAEDDPVFVRERTMGTFTRRVYLSEHLDADKIDAAYEGGVLAAGIPVLEQAKPRKIAIQTSENKAIATKNDLALPHHAPRRRAT